MTEDDDVEAELGPYRELQAERLENYWAQATPETRQRLLALDEHHTLPDDVVAAMRLHGISLAEYARGDGKWTGVQSYHVKDFLARKRQEQDGG